MNKLTKVAYPDQYAFSIECQSADHYTDMLRSGKCFECNTEWKSKSDLKPVKKLKDCELGIEPHDFQVEDQGEQVDLKCRNCGKISKE